MNLNLRKFRLFIFSVLFTSALTGALAEIEGTPTYRLKLGPKFGYDFFSTQLPFFNAPARGLDDIGYGVTAGFALRNEWIRRWYLETAALCTYGHSPIQIQSQLEPSLFGNYDLERGAIMVPVHFGYKFDVINRHGMSIFFGGWGSYGFAGRLDHESEAFSRPYKLYGKDGIWRRIGIGASLGFTIELSEHVSVVVDGLFGLRKMSKYDIFPIRQMNESSLRIGISYWVPKRKKNKSRIFRKPESTDSFSDDTLDP